MDRVPFIVEVWDTRKNAFIGLAKVNLSKVKQGFLLGGQHIKLADSYYLIGTVYLIYSRKI